MTTDILLLYETGEKQTEKIAVHLEKKLKASGFGVDLFRARDLPENVHAKDYRFLLLGDSIHAGGFHKPLRKFIANERQTIDGMPHAFFAVCMSAAHKDPAQRERTVKEVLNHFHQQTGWQPKYELALAGALMYREYNPFIRWVMRRISKAAGGETDTSRNWEYTDWNEVDRLADYVATQLRSRVKI